MVEKLVPSFELRGRDFLSAVQIRATTTNENAYMLQRFSEPCKCRLKYMQMQELAKTGDKM